MKATSVHKTVLIKIVKLYKHVESLMDMFWTWVRIPSGPLLGLGYNLTWPIKQFVLSLIANS